MASITTGLIAKAAIGESTHNIASTAYAVCTTAAATAEKTVEMTGFSLIQGATIHVKFTNSNTAATPTLNVNSVGPKSIMAYGSTKPGTTETKSWYAGSVVTFTYDGTNWIMGDYKYNQPNENTDYRVKQSPTTENASVPILLTKSSNGSEVTDSTKFATGVTVNPSTGNVSATSFTGGGSGITGVNAATVNSHTVESDVPSNAKFTDTVTTVTSSGTGNVVTSMSATNGAITYTKGASVPTLGGDNAFTGSNTFPTQSSGDNSTKVATTAYVKNEIDSILASYNAMMYKGTIAGGSTGAYGALTPAANAGDVYVVSTAGKINGISVEAGDMLICKTDGTAAATSSNYSSTNSKWDFIQTNIVGAVTGPSSSVTDRIAVFDGTGGNKIKDGGVTLSDFIATYTQTVSVGSMTSAGTLPTTEDKSVSSVSVTNGTAASCTKTEKTIPNVTSVGSMTTASVNDAVLTITIGSAPTLGTAIKAHYIDSFSGGTPTAVTATSVTVKSVKTVGTLPSSTSVSVLAPLS